MLNMKESCLYDSQGYEIRIEISKTYNPSKHGESADIRELGVLLCYLGAAQTDKPESPLQGAAQTAPAPSPPKPSRKMPPEQPAL